MHPDASLTNQLLIAMPGMLDPNFSTTVTLICEHNDEGALGIVINRPTDLKLGGLFEQLSVDNPDPGVAKSPVLSGGPVGIERGFVLHGPEQSYENTLAVSSDIRLTLSRDIIDAMAAGSGPEHTLVALGYAGWDAGQLEEEILANSWLNVPATPEIVFEMPFAERWNSAARTLGIDISAMSTDAGHAWMPGPATILAFDFGLRRIGVAVGQSITGSASPLGVIANRDSGVDHDAIATLVAEWHPGTLVVGMPVHADGSASEMQAPVQAFIDELARYGIPVETVDERYTSVEAERVLKEARAGGTRGRIRKEDIDSAAAVFIAERYLLRA